MQDDRLRPVYGEKQWPHQVSLLWRTWISNKRSTFYGKHASPPTHLTPPSRQNGRPLSQSVARPFPTREILPSYRFHRLARPISPNSNRYLGWQQSWPEVW